MIKDYQMEEITRCRVSPEYFVNNYGWMKHLRLGPIRFITWDWQNALMRLWTARKSTITLKSRQTGFSWTAAAWINWMMLFNANFDILLLSANQEKATKLLSKLMFFRDRLPSWMKSAAPAPSRASFSQFMKYYDDTVEDWVTGDGQITSLTTTSTSGAGDSATVVLIDEFALMTARGNDENVWAAIAPTTLHGGLLIMGSTPRSSSGQFYYNWNDSIEPLMNEGIIDDSMTHRGWNRAVLRNVDKLEVVPVKAHYSMCYHNKAWLAAACKGMSKSRSRVIRKHFENIKYDAAWKKAVVEKLKLTESQAEQELELKFDQPGGQAFNGADIEACYVPGAHSDLIKSIGVGGSHFYIGIDTAEGVTAKSKNPDLNSIVVFNDKGVQVLGLHNRENLNEWAGTTVVGIDGKKEERYGTVYKTIVAHRPCTVINEKNGPGGTVDNRVRPLLADFDDVEFFSLPMSTKKPKFVGDMQAALGDEQILTIRGVARQLRKILITDFKTYQSIKHFLKIGPGTFGPSTGFYDDPVISTLWAIQAMKMREAYNSDGALAGPEGATDAARRELAEHGGNSPFANRTPELPVFVLPPRQREDFNINRGFSGGGEGRRFGGHGRRFGDN